MQHACPVAMIRAPCAGFRSFSLVSAIVVDAQVRSCRIVPRIAVPARFVRTLHSTRPFRRRKHDPKQDSRSFGASSASFARKRWIKSPPKGTVPEPRPDNHVPRTWQDYSPDVGIPLDSGELDLSTIQLVFGSDMDEAKGNHILRLMNYRRLSGSLIDIGTTFPREAAITQESAANALEYLRQQDPAFDEQEAGAAWADLEVLKVEQQYMQRAEDVGIYKRSAPDGADVAEEQGTTYGRARYGESALVELRKANKARWMEEDRKKKEMEDRQEAERIAQLRSSGQDPDLESTAQPKSQRTQQGSDTMALHEPGAKAWLQPVERKAWVKYYEDQATIVKENKVPKMSTLRRLGPAALLALGVVGGCLALHEMYTPPPKSARMFPDIPPSVATLGAITAINTAVFVAWRIPFLWRTMNKYFLVAPGYPYALGVFGAQFGHQTIIHLVSNTVLLWPFGLMLHEDVGRGTFLAIYLGSGVIGAYGSLLYNVLKKNWLYYIFGSSTAVFGTMAATCLLRADHDVTVFGYRLPITGLTVLGLFGGLEVLTAWKGSSLSVDHAGHFTSMATGAAAAWYIRRQIKRTEMTRQEHVEAFSSSVEATPASVETS